MFDTVQNIGWSMVFSLIGGLVGMVLVLLASVVVPRLVDRFTPNMDEQKEEYPRGKANIDCQRVDYLSQG